MVYIYEELSEGLHTYRAPGPAPASTSPATSATVTYQGIEFFSALRRPGKEAYMFVYNGEPHGLRNRDNMKHWTVHQDEFFDHYLLGRPKPEWMDKGVPFLERGKRDVSDLFKPRPARATTDSVQR
jgi:hypothetical protein